VVKAYRSANPCSSERPGAGPARCGMLRALRGSPPVESKLLNGAVDAIGQDRA
jgi:hypothetical protein